MPPSLRRDGDLPTVFSDCRLFPEWSKFSSQSEKNSFNQSLGKKKVPPLTIRSQHECLLSHFMRSVINSSWSDLAVNPNPPTPASSDGSACWGQRFFKASCERMAKSSSIYMQILQTVINLWGILISMTPGQATDWLTDWLGRVSLCLVPCENEGHQYSSLPTRANVPRRREAGEEQLGSRAISGFTFFPVFFFFFSKIEPTVKSSSAAHVCVIVLFNLLPSGGLCAS